MKQAGIIGAGNIGCAVAQRLIATGHEVRMANRRGPESLGDQANVLGIVPATLEQAAGARDVVLIAIPEYAVAELPDGLFAHTPADAIILDAGNYYPGVRDGSIAEIDGGMPDSQWVVSRIGRPVIKMFNMIHANRIAESHRPAGAPDRLCLTIAGDDPEDRARAIALADSIGFDGLDAGALTESWRQQPGTPVYCAHLGIDAARAALAAARRDAVTAARQEALDRARSWQANGAQVGLWNAAGRSDRA
ncbi:hypothetical protein J3E64_002017 [Sphingobium sp. OAS761]|nr:hypothetical protein [Sphingobium sp. OAS761]